MDDEQREDLRKLVVYEIQRVVVDLEIRQRFLVEMWGRHRDRGPLLDTLFSRWRTLTMGELMGLDAEAVPYLEAFYRELDELRLFFRFTEDMPTTLDDRYAHGLKHLRYFADAALEVLGGRIELPKTPWDDE